MRLCDLPLYQAAESLRRGDVTAEDYCRRLLERCTAGRSLNAFISLDPERLLAEARGADRRRRGGQPLGPLHGIPLAIKDIFDVAGTPTTAGTPALRDSVPSRTAPLVQRLFDAGALMLGKTNLHELCFGITSSNEFTGAVRNPYDQTKSPGGSSGGTAAAVAARMAPAGLGSDTSGSIRIPAAHCGLVGYRPSSGRYPPAGMVPLSHSRDAPGLMARSVRDVALLDEVIAGDGSLQPLRLEGMRIGLPGESFFAGLDSRVAAVIEAELERLRRLGVELIEADPPDFATARAEAAGPLVAWEMPRDLERYLKDVGKVMSFAELVASVASPYVKSELEDILASGGPALEARYDRAISEVVPRHRAEYEAYLRENDLAAIAFPTSPLAPAAVGENGKVMVDGTAVSIWLTLRNSVPATLLGAPALSLPAGLTEDGLPVGLELDGFPGADRALLSVGLAWERSSPAMPAPEI